MATHSTVIYRKYTILLAAVSAQAQRSEGTASVSVAGRSVVGSIPRLTTSGQVEGTVVVAIKVDQYGNVTEATPGAEGTTTTNSSVWKAARSAAMRAHFNMKADAPALQDGTITYTFVSSGLADTDETALKFMGIPIDGPEEQFFEALKAKGFKKGYSDDYATGMFNGEEVRIYLSTNHKMVDRVRVIYPYCSEENDTRVKYNMLLSRFNRNAKYVCVNPRSEVPANEKIYWKLQENTKAYDAVYFFLPMKVSAAVSGVVWFTMTSIHTIDINYINFHNRPRGEDL